MILQGPPALFPGFLAGTKTMETLVVSREAIDAYERRTGFVGIGEFFIQKGLFILKEDEQCKKN
jgi:hypothetical protein